MGSQLEFLSLNQFCIPSLHLGLTHCVASFASRMLPGIFALLLHHMKHWHCFLYEHTIDIILCGGEWRDTSNVLILLELCHELHI